MTYSKPNSTKRKRIRNRLPQKCVRCGATENLTLDHIVARVLGGTNEPSNFQILCNTCNQAKAVLEEKEAEQRKVEARKLRKQQKAAYFIDKARRERIATEAASAVPWKRDKK